MKICTKYKCLNCCAIISNEPIELNMSKNEILNKISKERIEGNITLHECGVNEYGIPELIGVVFEE